MASRKRPSIVEFSSLFSVHRCVFPFFRRRKVVSSGCVLQQSMMQQPVCHVCEESVRPSRVCSSCNRPYHRQCGLVVSDAVPPGWTEPEYKAHARREKCWSCATLELQQRAGSKITLYTPGTSLGLLAKLTLRGVESFFKYLGLEEQNQPEDYRRDREEAVFKLYKMVSSSFFFFFLFLLLFFIVRFRFSEACPRPSRLPEIFCFLFSLTYCGQGARRSPLCHARAHDRLRARRARARSQRMRHSPLVTYCFLFISLLFCLFCC
jgi:hypothetical protein